jgi:hypothetical protein
MPRNGLSPEAEIDDPASDLFSEMEEIPPYRTGIGNLDPDP